MTSRNEITGDAIQTKLNSDSYRDNYDRIFGSKVKKKSLPVAYDGKCDSVLGDVLDENRALREAIDDAMGMIGD